MPEFEPRATPRSEVDSDRAMALFLLKMQEVQKVSQSALNDIVTDFAFLCSRELALLKSRVFKCLSQTGVDPQNVAGLQEIFAKCNLLQRPYLYIFKG